MNRLLYQQEIHIWEKYGVCRFSRLTICSSTERPPLRLERKSEKYSTIYVHILKSFPNKRTRGGHVTSKPVYLTSPSEKGVVERVEKHTEYHKQINKQPNYARREWIINSTYRDVGYFLIRILTGRGDFWSKQADQNFYKSNSKQILLPQQVNNLWWFKAREIVYAHSRSTRSSVCMVGKAKKWCGTNAVSLHLTWPND